MSSAHTVAATGKVASGLAAPDEHVDWAQAVRFENLVDFEEGSHPSG
ncbi:MULTISPECIES: hypothetical protein [unclassified Streptomyces]